MSRQAPRAAPSRRADALLAVGLAGALVAIGFLTRGGKENLAANTWVEITLLVIGAAAAAAMMLDAGLGRRGALALALFGALAALTFASIAWSVAPDVSWQEANRTLSYLAAFGAAAALARLAPGRWPALVWAIALATTAICCYTLLAKVFPATLDANDTLGRLQVPFGYFNATGLIAALGVVPCVWVGARREGGVALCALSAPAIAILTTVMVLSYSRGALLAAVLGAVCWFTLAPLRLRSALILAVGLAGGAVATAWALSQHAIVGDNVALPARTATGHSFGLVLAGVLVVTALFGVAVGAAMERTAVPVSTRRRIGIALVVVVALVPIGGLGALAASARGFTGEISHLWSQAISSNSGVGNNPNRLAQLGSSRSNYWSVGVKVGAHAPLAGVGARGYATARPRYTPSLLSTDAHSYLVETFADFGVIGVVLSLALLGAWAMAARVTLAGNADRPVERAGLVALLSVAVVFGIHAAIDITWFIPGVAIPALLCAGWLAGRGATPAPARLRLRASPGRAAALIALAAATLIAAWVVWQPLRSSDADTAAIAALDRGEGGAALTDARTAVATDPLSAGALWILGNVYEDIGLTAQAHREFIKATTVQPANPATWDTLGEFDVQHGLAGQAVRAFARALRLEPFSPQVKQELAGAQARS